MTTTTNTVDRQRVIDAERHSDHGDYSAMIRRMLRAYARRLADADPDDLILLMGARDELDTAISAAVAGMRERGFSWTEIAAPLGITRQAAQQRWTSSPTLTVAG